MFDGQFVQHLDWQRTVGLQLGMINGQEPPGRNVFYDRMLKDHVRDRCCVDIGFGTGLLSMLAIKHGAEHVEAWECDRDVYELGRAVIHQLQLDHRISLHHGRFNAGSLESTDRVVFHEIVGSRIWNEGLRSALPLAADVVLPAVIRCEFDLITASRDRVERLFFQPRRFEPGVVTVPGFQETIQAMIDVTPVRGHKHRDILNQLGTIHSADRWRFYEIDFDRCVINGDRFDHIPACHERRYQIDMEPHQAVIMYPRISIRYRDIGLHWGWHDPIIVDESGSYTIDQDFNDGAFTLRC